VAVAVLFSLVMTSCQTGQTGVRASPATTAAPEFKVTVGGDSISVGLGAELRKTVGPDVNVVVIGEEGTGLSRPEKFDWPARLEKLAREYPPGVLVFSVGSNDAQNLLDPSGAVVASSASEPEWDAEYSRRLARSFDAFAHSGTTVIWVGQVRTIEDRIGLVNRRIHRLAEGVAAGRPWVRVTDLADYLTSGETRAERCLKPDGVHLTVECLDEAAVKLAAQLPAASEESPGSTVLGSRG